MRWTRPGERAHFRSCHPIPSDIADKRVVSHIQEMPPGRGAPVALGRSPLLEAGLLAGDDASNNAAPLFSAVSSHPRHVCALRSATCKNKSTPSRHGPKERPTHGSSATCARLVPTFTRSRCTTPSSWPNPTSLCVALGKRLAWPLTSLPPPGAVRLVDKPHWPSLVQPSAGVGRGTHDRRRCDPDDGDAEGPAREPLLLLLQIHQRRSHGPHLELFIIYCYKINSIYYLQFNRKSCWRANGPVGRCVGCPSSRAPSVPRRRRRCAPSSRRCPPSIRWSCLSTLWTTVPPFGSFAPSSSNRLIRRTKVVMLRLRRILGWIVGSVLVLVVPLVLSKGRGKARERRKERRQGRDRTGTKRNGGGGTIKPFGRGEQGG
jgi:hypothetical protein